MEENGKYFKYKLTFPYNGAKIYKSKSLSDGVKKCYTEFAQLNDVQDGIFGVTNIDTNNEHTFKVTDGNLYKYNKNNKTQNGGFSIYETLSPMKIDSVKPASETISAPNVNAPNVNTPNISASNISASASQNVLPDMQDSSATKSVANPDNIYEIINNISNRINNEINVKTIEVSSEYPVNAPIIENNYMVVQNDESTSSTDKQIDVEKINISNIPINDEIIVLNGRDTSTTQTPSSTPSLSGSASPFYDIQQNKIIELLNEINKNVNIVKDTLVVDELISLNQTNNMDNIVDQPNMDNMINNINDKPYNKYLQDIENPDAWTCIIF